MGDTTTTNRIDLAVTDAVDAGIAPKLIAIADASDRAGSSVGSLKSQLASLNGSGFTSLASQLTSVQSGTAQLTISEGNLTTQVKANVSAVREQSAAYREAVAARERLRAENAGIISSEQATAAQWDRSATSAERAAAAQQGLSEARERDAELQAFAGQVADALTAQLNAQAIATREQAAAEAERIAAQEVQAELSSAQLQASTALSGQSEIEAAAYIQLAEATNAVNLSKANLSQIRKQVIAGDLEEQQGATLLAGALIEEKTATEQLQLAQANLADVQQFLATETASVTDATVANAVAQRGAASAAQGAVSANMSGAAAMGVLEMRTLSTTRAATNFITKVLGLGPLLQAAFPIIGAVALLAVIYQIGDAFYKLIKNANDAAHNIASAFDEAIGSIRKSNDELAVTNDKLDQTIARLERRPTTNGAAESLDQARLAADKLDSSLEHVDTELDKILQKNQVGFIAGLLTGQDSTKDTSKFITDQFQSINAKRDEVTTAIDKATDSKDPKTAQAAVIQGYANERTAIQGVIAALNEEYNRRKALQDAPAKQTGSDQYGTPIYTKSLDQTANLTALGKSVQLAREELRGLDLTMSNINKNDAVDKLRDQTSAMKNETREAAAQWKQLLADFVAFQTAQDKAGHKATPQQDLDFLVGKESTINPLNRDKLQAKELPYRNQVNGNDFVNDQTAKLQDQVASIGLYNNALKEQNELDKIQEAARKRHIDLTTQDIAVFKGLIAQIVESKEYTQELNNVYETQNGASVKYNAQVDAMRTLMQRGQLTVAQFAEGLASVTKEYNESASAVTKYQDALAQADKDSASKLGSDRQMAVKGDLNSFDERLRNTRDASHPTGYSESDITSANEQLAPLIQAQKDKNAVDQAANAIIEQRTNLQDKLLVQQQALAQAVQAGAISQGNANNINAQGQLQLKQQQVNNGTITSGSQPYTAALGEDYLKQWQGTAKGIQDAFQPVFKTLGDGFADSMGRAIVYSKNLGTALKEVAQSAVAELISALIKMVEEMVIAKVLASALGFSGGGSASGGGFLKLLGFSQGGLVRGYADGGSVWGAGTATSDSIPAMLSHGEYVVNAAAASQNRDLLDAMNSGSQATRSTTTRAQSASTAGTGVKPMQVQVHNYGNGQVQAQQIDEHTVRLIVNQETPQLIAKHAPSVIANDIANPNGATSKAIYRNVTPARVR